MALIAIHLELLAHARNQLLRSERPLKLLSLGYPDVLVEPHVMELILTPEQIARLQYRDDSEGIARWHGAEKKLSRIPETSSVLSAMGFAADYVDISPSRGVEMQADLNLPLPEKLVGQYDMVLDLGTLEHCFNIGQAMMNVMSALREGGCVLHSNPMAHIDHGFYNLNPTFYRDFYGQNGGLVHYMKCLVGSPFKYDMFDISHEFTSALPPAKTVLLTVARRKHVQPLVWPTQGKYLANSSLKTTRPERSDA